ncbi:GTP-binding protein Obg/CgtA [Sarocladium strictum]
MAFTGSRTVVPLLPFLYPSLLLRSTTRTSPFLAHQARAGYSTCSDSSTSSTVNELPESRLNPRPDDYGATNFADKAIITLYAGRGGNGCVSFHREAFLPDGPPNGGDGGAGGNVYIQAAHGETSLHKLSRRRFARAGRGRHGQGSAKGGTRGEDVILTVPVGTIVREIERTDPATEQEEIFKLYRAAQRQRLKQERIAEDARRIEAKKERLAREAERAAAIEAGEIVEEVEEETAVKDPEEDDIEEMEEEEELYEEEEEDPDADDPQREKWLLHPGMSKSDMRSAEFPRLPRRDRLLLQPPAPIYLDLSRPTERPYLLAAGGLGGLGNPHFASRSIAKPIFATKGDDAVTIKIELELKLLADVGLVGLPNAGKSTLLRSITNSRTRVGNWAFTTLQPNIGTVILDKYSGRPSVSVKPSLSAAEDAEAGPRTRFTIADIPGLIEGAHLDKGLGIAFLRHVERAGVLAFVIDLNAGNAVSALKALWREVGLYAEMREDEERYREVDSLVDWDVSSESTGTVNLMNASTGAAPASNATSVKEIAGKPWFVVATKADLPGTQENFEELQSYLEGVTKGDEPHPSGAEEDAWTTDCRAIPVSAINGQGTDRIVHWVAGLLAK